jgi:hypothetical protein
MSSTRGPPGVSRTHSAARIRSLWVQASLDYKQRLQQLFFPLSVAFDEISSIEPP